MITYLVKGIYKQFVKLYYRIKPFLSWILFVILYKEKDINPYLVPIIINNRNRLTSLRMLVDTLEKYGYKNIFVIDNASTYSPLLEYYKNEYKFELIRLSQNIGHQSLWKTGLIKQFRDNYFVYTDSDVLPIDECPNDFIELFIKLFNQNPLLEKVGFSLKIDDLPDSYDKKENVIKWESQFWRRKIGDNPPLYKAAIDTTFAVYKPYYILGGNLKSPHIRVGYPYQCRHLPWYVDSEHLDNEELYYKNNCATPSHWIKGSFDKPLKIPIK